MNRSDILKKCVDRGVAGETEVGAVSHLFYVYLLSALQRGQRVEVPSFGTFGTRVAGVKRTRKIPYFEPEQDLSSKVNQRFENLRSLVTGKYVVTPQAGDAEYKGAQPPYDPTVERGKEYIFDTSREVPLDDYERAAASGTKVSQQEEEHVMPRLNLQDEEEGAGVPPEHEESTITPPPTLRDVGPDGGSKAPWLAIVVGVLVLAAAVVSLNYFHVIHLWGKKVPRVVEQLPEPTSPTETSTPSAGQQPATTTPPATGQEETPLPSVTPEKGKVAATEQPAASTPNKKVAVSAPTTSTTPAATSAPAGTGKFTVQISSWKSKAKANRQAQELSSAGFDAYVIESDVKGEAWHRVRVGRFGTMGEARDVIAKLQATGVDGVWVTTLE
jgi:cell division protein FtsN/nucleoid DNA-binding protein